MIINEIITSSRVVLIRSIGPEHFACQVGKGAQKDTEVKAAEWLIITMVRTRVLCGEDVC